jgi:hypothetical protein
MPFITCDIVPSNDPEFPFQVVFKKGDTVVSQWLVMSKADGEEQVIECLQELAVEDDDEEEDAA